MAALEYAYLASGLVIALHYLPLLRRAWLHPAATVDAQSLWTWAVWALCRCIAFAYGVFVLQDRVFLIVVGADLVGRLLMAVLILRARAWVARRPTATGPVTGNVIVLRPETAAAQPSTPSSASAGSGCAPTV